MSARLYRVTDAGAIKRPGAGYDDEDRYVEAGFEFRADIDSKNPWAEALPELLARGLVFDVAADAQAAKEAAELDARLNALVAGGPVIAVPPILEPGPAADEPKPDADEKPDKAAD
jgi:hypothetical protein